MSKKPDPSPNYAKHLNSQLWTCSLPYFTEMVAPHVNFRESLKNWLVHSESGQETLAEVVEQLKEMDEKRVKVRVKKSIREYAEKNKKQPPHKWLRHLMGLDKALISLTQWKQYQSVQEEKSGVGGEAGRRISAYLNRYILQKKGIKLVSSNKRVAYKEPTQILGLILSAVRAKYQHFDARKYKMVVRVSVDGRNLKPFNVALTWTLLGFQLRKGYRGKNFIDFDTRELFPTQEWTSSIAMSMFAGEEKAEDILNNCPEVSFVCSEHLHILGDSCAQEGS